MSLYYYDIDKKGIRKSKYSVCSNKMVIAICDCITIAYACVITPTQSHVL
jgi:hypothetical protein